MVRGWRGDPPSDDDKARERVIAAAMRCVARHGPSKTGMSDVAAELGVTRQTVYRLYPSTDELLMAVARASVDGYLDRLAGRVAALTDPADAVVEGIAYTYERLPKERFLGLLLATGRSEAFLKGVTSAEAIQFGRMVLSRMNVDWAAWGFDEPRLDGLAEFGLRMLQSLVFDPPHPKRTRAQLREFLTTWLAPAIHARADDAVRR
jgi:AcrR family transcriptional regulator